MLQNVGQAIVEVKDGRRVLVEECHVVLCRRGLRAIDCRKLVL